MKYPYVLLAFFLVPVSWGKVSYPEVFEHFITGWVEYDEGAYAASYRAFRRAHALDPYFYPARDACVASLSRMNMPEAADFYMRDTSRKGKEPFTLEPKLAFWGVFKDNTFNVTGSDNVAKSLVTTVSNMVSLPVIEVSPTSQAWDDREQMTPCQYNMFVLLTRDAEGLLIARIHLIEAFDIENSSEFELAVEIPQLRQVRHSTLTIDLDSTGLTQYIQSPKGLEDIKYLLEGKWENMDAPFIVDAETASLPEIDELTDPSEIISKLAITEEPWKDYLHAIEYASSHMHSWDANLIEYGSLLWLTAITPKDADERPWILACASEMDRTYSLARLYPEYFNMDYNRFRQLLMTEYPEHITTKAYLINEDIKTLNKENCTELAPKIVADISKLLDEAGEEDAVLAPRRLNAFADLLTFYSGDNSNISHYPFFPIQLYAYAHKKKNHFYLLIASDQLASPSYYDKKAYLKRVSKDVAYAKEAWLMLELNPYHFSDDAPALYYKYEELIEQHPESPFMRGLGRAIDYRLRKGGHDVQLKEAGVANTRRVIAMIKQNTDWMVVYSSMPWSSLNNERRKEIVATIEERHSAYGSVCDGPDGLHSFLFAMSCFDIDPLSLSEQIRADVRARLVTKIDNAPGDWFAHGRRYLSMLKRHGHMDAFAEYSSFLAPTVERKLMLSEISDSCLRQANLFAQICIDADMPEAAMHFVDIGLEKFTSSSLENMALRHKYFELATTRARAMAVLHKGDEVIEYVNRISAELDGEAVLYKKWNASTNQENTVGDILLGVRDQQLAREGSGFAF